MTAAEPLTFEEAMTGHEPDPRREALDKLIGIVRGMPKHYRDQFMEGAVGAGAEIPASVLDAHTSKKKAKAVDDWQRMVESELQKLKIRHEAQELFDAEQRAQTGVSDGWAHVNVAALTGDAAVPTVCRREDGAALFYQGKVNVVFGDSESGKSWICLLACAQELAAGGSVAYLDYEDDPNGIISRLLALGVPRRVLDDPARFLYFRLHRGLTDEAFEWYENPYTGEGPEGLVSRTGFSECSLVVIDAMTEALSADGLNSNSDVDVAGWFNAFARRVAALGPAVAVIDHMGLSDKSRQNGSQMKKSATDGVSLAVKKGEDFAPGKSGWSSIEIAKDRHGGVKTHAEGKAVGRLVMPINPRDAHITEPIAMPSAEELAAATEILLTQTIEAMVDEGKRISQNAVTKRFREDGHSASDEVIRAFVREWNNGADDSS